MDEAQTYVSGSHAHNNLLLVTWSFPPLGGIGVQRALSLSKYLPDHGFNVHVLTAKNASTVVQDPGLLEHLPKQVTVHRVLAPDLPFSLKKALKRLLAPSSPQTERVRESQGAPGLARRALSFLTAGLKNIISPDYQALWAFRAVRRASDLIQQTPIDTVLMTAPPFSIFLIGNALKRRFPNICLIADYRDEWLTYYLGTLSYAQSSSMRRRCAQLEKETMSFCDGVVATTSSALHEISTRYPEEDPSKFRVVHNGYDPDAFANFASRPRHDNNVVLTYIGTVYRPANPDTFVQALARLPQDIRSRFEHRFIGRVEDPAYRSMLQKYSEIKVFNVVPQQQAFSRMEETDYLLLIWHDHINIPGKLFEYLATGKPVLALVQPRGEVWHLMQETGVGWCADVSDPDSIADLLKAAYVRTRPGADEFKPNWSAIRKYERPKLVAEYAQYIKTWQRHEYNR